MVRTKYLWYSLAMKTHTSYDTREGLVRHLCVLIWGVLNAEAAAGGAGSATRLCETVLRPPHPNLLWYNVHYVPIASVGYPEAVKV
jgi:hypothetical protein